MSVPEPGSASKPATPGANARFRAGIVGVGLISDHHVSAVQALPDVELVGVCDLDHQRAEARAAEWSTTAFKSLDELVAAGANVIHVLTPPSAHATVALEALGLGCHVLVEKPLAESAEDVRRIGEAAAERGLVATVDHSLLYDPQVLAALEQVRAGVIGDVIGVDVFRSLEYPPYEGGPLPPHMREAGYPWRDAGIHGLYLVQELLGTINGIDADWRSLGGDRNLAFDEWRAVVRCERGFGQLQLSWNEKPQGSQIMIRGTGGVLRVDLFAMFQSKRLATPMPKAAERVVNAYRESIGPMFEVPANVFRFLRKEIRPYQGVRNLITDFYARLAAGEPPPVSIEDAAGLVDQMEKVARAADAEHSEALARTELSPTTPFLVTGASGSLGSAVVRRLLGEGHRVRAFVRRKPDEPVQGVEYALGNLGDSEAVDRAVEGAEVVIHAGAAMAGGWQEHLGSTVIGTRNVIDACRRFEVAQLVHVSSLSVVDAAGASGGRPIDEETPLEPRPQERGAYTRAKLEAEIAVSAAVADGLACVILRPGVLFGVGLPAISAAVARRAGERWVFLGTGLLAVPLVYIEDVVDAIMATVDRKLVSGEVIQLVDEEVLVQEEIVKSAGPAGGKFVHVPLPALKVVGRFSEYALGKLGRQSPLGPYRLDSALAELSFDSDRAANLLDWKPRVGVREGIRRGTEDPA